MPDLNYDHPTLREEIIKIGKFWLNEFGVDGFRLDAAKYIFPLERTEDTRLWWQTFRREMERVKPGVYLVGEVWDDTPQVARLLKGLGSAFHFELSFALGKALRENNPAGLVPQLKAARQVLRQAAPSFQDAIFLSNHDQDRIMSQLGGHAKKMKLAAAVLLTLPGVPYIYYGEEIGMRGQKPDEYIREPFVWDFPGQAEDATYWLPSKHNTNHLLLPPAEVQRRDSLSLHAHYRKAIALRNAHPELYAGEIEETGMTPPGLLAFERVHEGKKLLVLHNFFAKTLVLPLPEKYRSFRKMLFHTRANPLPQGQFFYLLPYNSCVLAPSEEEE